MTTHGHLCPRREDEGDECECVLAISGVGIRYEHGTGRRHCGNATPCPGLTNKCACGEAVKAQEAAGETWDGPVAAAGGEVGPSTTVALIGRQIGNSHEGEVWSA